VILIHTNMIGRC